MSQPAETYQVHPIGTVRQSEAGFCLEIKAEYRDALKELDRFSHVHVFWWFDQADEEEWRTLTQAELPYAPGQTAGMFACRGPARPNPIALTTCPILHIDAEKGLVVIAYIDAFDGTPILDLKPYIPVSDRVRDVKVAEWFQNWPQWMEDAADFDWAAVGLSED